MDSVLKIFIVDLIRHFLTIHPVMSKQLIGCREGSWDRWEGIETHDEKRDSYDAYSCWQFLLSLFSGLLCFKVIEDGMNMCVAVIECFVFPQLSLLHFDPQPLFPHFPNGPISKFHSMCVCKLLLHSSYTLHFEDVTFKVDKIFMNCSTSSAS